MYDLTTYYEKAYFRFLALANVSNVLFAIICLVVPFFKLATSDELYMFLGVPIFFVCGDFAWYAHDPIEFHMATR